MTDKAKEILDNIKNALPELTESEQERLLGFSEGLVYKSKTEPEPA